MAGIKFDYATPSPHSKSGVRGVSYDRTMDKWEVKVMHDRKRIRIGRYDTVEDASFAHAEYVRQLKDTGE